MQSRNGRKKTEKSCPGKWKLKVENSQRPKSEEMGRSELGSARGRGEKKRVDGAGVCEEEKGNMG